ncbi:hypothetical protein NLJ89_g11717 [Agrocybe chaxingu]|uniref:Uncharacterized protein n=1 Tax=Agrocybe chaxingu TaxID=84603 RepID=A0A9W8JN82_9AGAR|nr:hypothetical protein NLJ89_g11717 [Agrocybe chaxingu]
MSYIPASQPHLGTHPGPSTSPRRGHGFPNTRDRGACARFRLHRKATKTSSSRPPCGPPSSMLELQKMMLDLYRQLNTLTEMVAHQALAFNQHISSCTAMMNNVSAFATAHPSANAPYFHHTDDKVLPTSGGNNPGTHVDHADAEVQTSNEIDTVAILEPFRVNNKSSPAATVPHTATASPSQSLPSPSMSGSLPRLRGFFNRPRPKPKPG